ncbi:DUF928 domain-containing protein [Chitinophaga jiangningensis]|nr:DUF928 domain-containing protein [Chitinophaga jiangningensis]
MMAQVTTIFIPELQGRTLDGLLQAKFNSTATARQRASVTITVTAASVGKVVTVKIPALDLQPGVNAFPAGILNNASLQFGDNKIATVLRQAGFFAEAEYEYCFEVTDGNGHIGGMPLGQQCFDYSLKPFSPLVLTSPMDEDKICEKRPNFFWQPLLPAIPGVQYRLILTSIKPDQRKAEAIRYNMPIINQSFINGPMLYFPPTLPELTEGQKYVWQVTAYRADMLLASSEMWEFTVKCKDNSVAVTPESYRDIDDLAKGNFYLSNGYIRFAVKNIYASSRLRYEIASLTTPDKVVKHLPVIELRNGQNHIEIDLTENRYMQDGAYYIITVHLPDGSHKQLRFLFKK